MLKSTLIHQGRVFRFVQEEYQLPNGKRAVIDKVEHPGAVVILPLDEHGKLILIRQYRQSVRETIFEFPAGTLEVGEDPLECAKREIVEEIGQSASTWQDLGKLLPTPGFCNEIQHCYFATGLSESYAEKDEDEQIESVRLSVVEVEQMIRKGEFKDGKSLAIFLRARLSKLL